MLDQRKDVRHRYISEQHDSHINSIVLDRDLLKIP